MKETPLTNEPFDIGLCVKTIAFSPVILTVGLLGNIVLDIFSADGSWRWRWMLREWFWNTQGKHIKPAATLTDMGYR